MENKDLLLSNLKELCYRAHSGISFSPEKRADYFVKIYSQELEEDLQSLGENKGNYKEKYISKFSDWMNAKSRCISSMIAGPSNFPVRKAEKYNNWEHNKYEDFRNWRSKYFKSVNRKPTPTPEEDLDNALKRLDELVIYQETMKEMNKIIKKEVKKDFVMSELVQKLKDEEYPENMIIESLKDGNWWGYGFAPFALTNNNSTIKRTREKIIVMKARIERKETFQDIKFEGGYATIEDDRVKIYHEEKPCKETIQEIKSNGFRWSPHWKCWCRKHTGNAIHSLLNLSFIKNK